jgi:HPr kinase/phosphorylase
MSASPTVHASVALTGARAVLIRGPAGSGKSRLVLRLLGAAQAGLLRFARLVADDRVHLEAVNGRLVARAPGSLQGLIEARGVGVRRVEYESLGVVGLVVDLAVVGAARMPDLAEREAEIAGIRLPRLGLAPGVDPLPAVLAALCTTDAGDGPA